MRQCKNARAVSVSGLCETALEAFSALGPKGGRRFGAENAASAKEASASLPARGAMVFPGIGAIDGCRFEEYPRAIALGEGGPGGREGAGALRGRSKDHCRENRPPASASLGQGGSRQRCRSQDAGRRQEAQGRQETPQDR